MTQKSKKEEKVAVLSINGLDLIDLNDPDADKKFEKLCKEVVKNDRTNRKIENRV